MTRALSWIHARAWSIACLLLIRQERSIKFSDRSGRSDVSYIIEGMNSSCVNERHGLYGVEERTKGSRNFNAQDDRIIIIIPRVGLRGRKPDVARRASPPIFQRNSVETHCFTRSKKEKKWKKDLSKNTK